MHSPMRSPILLAYALVTAVYLTLSSLHMHPYDSIVKCILAPVLFVFVCSHRITPIHLLIALVGCWLGDIFLELPESFFVPGMACFAVGHIGFIATFLKRGAKEYLRERLWIVLPYAVVGAFALWWAWFGLPIMLRIAAPVYGLLLLGTATTSISRSWLCGIGGGMFMCSDATILLHKAGKIGDTVAEGLIMPLYILAILFMTLDTVMYDLDSGKARNSVNSEQFSVPVGGFDPNEPSPDIDYSNMKYRGLDH